MEFKNTKTILAVLLVLLLCSNASAFGRRRCRGCFTGHFVPVIVQTAPVTLYQTSIGLEIEAAVEAALRQRGLSAPANVAGYAAAPQAQQSQQQAPTGSVLQARCASCHANGDSSGGQWWDMSQPMTIETFERIVEMVGEAERVPAQMTNVINNLQPQERAIILSEIIALRKHAKEQLATKPQGPPQPVDSSRGPRIPQPKYISPFSRV